MSRKRLSDEAIDEALEALEGWARDGDRLRRQFRFPDFVAAFSWMTAVALFAEKLDHHPDWTNVYNRVDVSLWTHDAGGVTGLDVRMARHMNELYSG
jgi:4a-hydroxytetrahydrobiopterin dehydratase